MAETPLSLNGAGSFAPLPLSPVRASIPLMCVHCLAFLAALVLCCHAEPTTPEAIATEIIAPLIDPAKVATLKGDRPANPRLYKIEFWLETARRAGGDPAEVIDTAQTVAGYVGTVAASEDKFAILSNREKMDVLGCLTDAGMAKLRKGGSPEITIGPQAGTDIHLDHILPIKFAPELAARFFNLDAITSHDNEVKGAKIGQRELDLARRWNREELLSAEGVTAVETAANVPR